MKAYKLTDEKGKTKNDTQWGINVTHSASGEGKKLCTNGWIHFYVNPLIAVIMNPAHAGFVNPILWECETSGEELHGALKAGCKTLTTIKEIDLPVIAINSKIAFGILCAKRMYSDLEWNTWADNWLAGKDRTAAAAYAAAAAAGGANAAAGAAGGAAYAAYAAAYNRKMLTVSDFIEIANQAMLVE